LFPIEMNDEKPSGVERRGGAGDPEAVRADQAGPVPPDEREQPVLELDPLASDLREAGRDDAEGPRSLPKRCLAPVEDATGRKAHDGEVDLAGDLVDRPIALDPCDRGTVAVHRVGLASKATRDDVAKEHAADRPGSRGSTQHGHARGLEERAQRGDNGGVVPLVDARPIGLRRGDGELELERPELVGAGDVEARLREHAEHCGVLGQDCCDEALDPVAGGVPRELLQEAGADSAALEVVCDREGHLRCGRVPKAVVCGGGHDTLGLPVSKRPDQGAALVPVRLEQRLNECRSDRRHPVEAQMEARRRQAAEQLEQRRRVGLPGRAEPERAAVPQDDVDDVLVVGHRAHHASPPAGRAP
jgi:hypothetical protein